MRTYWSPSQLRRMITVISRQFLGVGAECLHSVVKAQPDVREYPEIRRMTACARLHDLDQSHRRVRDSPAVWLQQGVVNIARLCSDIYGSLDDVIGAWRDLGMNRPVAETLVSALAAERRHPRQQAMVEAAAIHRSQTEALIALSAELASDTGPELTRYLNALGPYLAGYHDYWHLSLTERYHWTDEFRSPQRATPPAR